MRHVRVGALTPLFVVVVANLTAATVQENQQDALERSLDLP